MDADRLQLLRTVADNPADDFPRLVMADWLEETDEPEWAELIRVQVEAARLRHALGEADRRLALERREKELLSEENVLRWSFDHGLPVVMNLSGTGGVFVDAAWDRGFVTRIDVPPAVCRERAGLLSSYHPVHTIRLTRWQAFDRSLPPEPRVALPWLRRLELPARAVASFEGAPVAVSGAGEILLRPPALEGIDVAFYASGRVITVDTRRPPDQWLADAERGVAAACREADNELKCMYLP